MLKETLTFNKGDWTGESITVEFVTLGKVTEFEIHGDMYRIHSEFRVADNNPKFAWTDYTIARLDGDKWASNGLKVGKADSDSYWMATDESGEYTRDSKDMRIAIAQLICFLG